MKFVVVAIVIFAVPILIGYAAPVNETNTFAKEITELKSNLSLVWKFLANLKSQIEVIVKPDLALLRVLPCEDEIELTEHSDRHPASKDEEDEMEEESEDEDDEQNEDKKKGHKDENDEDEKENHKDENDKRSLIDRKREKLKEKCSINSTAEEKIEKRAKRATERWHFYQEGRFFRFSKFLQQLFLRWYDTNSVSDSSSSGRYMKPFQPVTPSDETTNDNTNVTAFCSLQPNKAFPPEKRMDIRGKVYMTEKDANTLVVTVKVSGVQPSKSSLTVSQSLKHGIHVHQFGNLNNGCESTGSHFNPFNMPHGSEDSKERHLGDLGNIETDSLGNINKTIEFKLHRALTGPNSFIGKAIVIHEKVDDLGSNPSDSGSITTGNAGSRLACCILYKLE